MADPLTPDLLVYDLVTAGEPRLSPDGERILYTLSAPDRAANRVERQLWQCRIDGSEPRQLTHDGKSNAGGRWSPDGRRIVYVAKQGEPERSAIVLLDGNGAGRELARSAQPISGLVWSPAGRSLAYTAPFDPASDGTIRPAARIRVTRRIDYKQDNRADGYLGDVRQQLFVVDVASGACRMVTREPDDHQHPQWSPDARKIAVQMPNRNGMCSQLGIVDVESGRVDLVGPRGGVVGAWAWSPRGDRIFIAGEPERTWQLDLFVYDLAAKSLTRLTDDLACLPDAGSPTLEPPAAPVWLDERTVLFHAIRAGASELWTIDVATAALDLVHHWGGVASGLNVDAAHRFVVQGFSDFSTLGQIAVFDRESSAASIVTHFNEALLSEAPPALPEPLEIRREPFTIHGWLLKPPDFDPARRYPVVLDIHGGPNGFFGKRFDRLQQCLATNGFLVVVANPRGSGTYGRRFAQQVMGDWGGEDFRDLMAMLALVLERPYADAARVGITGFSYGGYMTAWTIGQTARFAAAVCGAPVFDMTSFYGTSDIGHIFGEQQWRVAPSQNPDWLRAHSPATFAHRATTPTLILHGEADQRCPIGQGEQMFVALHKAGCEVEFVRYPGASHLFQHGDDLVYRADYLARALAWFTSHLGGPSK
ncbi:MAG TPA: S9 family peptidase [Thermomicrobiales bacterium]|nr:S9 family peptidase [Thermomicrobiales bacterium]